MDKPTILIAIIILFCLALVIYFILYNDNIILNIESFVSEENEEKEFITEETNTPIITASPIPIQEEHMNEHIEVNAEMDTTMPINKKTYKYYEYPETFIENNEGINISELYNGYSGPLKGKLQWNKMTLAQCQDACNSMVGCAGFSRNNVDADSEGTCHPRNKVAQCHSIRKGNPSQRSFSSDYTTYIKSDISEQLTKCIGADLTLNRMIYIKSVAKPFHYITVEDNSVILKEFKSTGVEFAEKCKFYIIKGLEKSNTVSFRMVDRNDIHYYLMCDDTTNQLTISPIDVSHSTLNQRSKASFELYDGIYNEYMVSIRCPSMDGKKALYLSISDNNNTLPRIKLVTLEDANMNLKAKKAATFDIQDYITGTSILTTTSETPSPTNKPVAQDRFTDSTKPDSASLARASDLLNKIASKARYDQKDPLIDEIQKMDRSIMNANTSIEEKDLLNLTEQELSLWKNGVDKYNKILSNKQKELNSRIGKITNSSNKVQLRDLARDYYFLKSRADELS